MSGAVFVEGVEGREGCACIWDRGVRIFLFLFLLLLLKELHADT